MPILKFKTDKMFTDITDDIEKIVPKNLMDLSMYIPSIPLVVFFKLKMNCSI